MGINVLGLQFGHDGSQAVVKDGHLVSAVATERITRFKKERGCTKQSIKYVLDKADMKLDDIDVVAVTNWFWDRDKDGSELFDKNKDDFSITDDKGVEYNQQDYATFYQNAGQVAQGVYQFNIGDQQKPCMFIDHHFAHAAYSYFSSPYKDAICLSVDFADNMGSSHSVYYFDDESIIFRPFRRGGDFAIGSYYGQVCDYLGFYPSLTDAGKVMALAAYGEPNKDYKDFCWPKVVQMGDLFHGDQYFHTLSRFGIKDFPDQRVFSPQLKGEGGTPSPQWLDKKEWDSDLSKNIAATAQKVLEESIYNFVEKLSKTLGNMSDNLCLAGGTVLNCVSNGNLINSGLFKNVFVAPATGDDGLSIGGASFLAHQLNKNRKDEISQTPKKKTIHTSREVFEGGRTYSEEEIEDAIKSSSFTGKKLKDETIIKRVVDFIDEGKVVGWFEGGSELGPRALGHRSILGDARNPEMKGILNEKVKHREEFRPFAPVVPLEDVKEWFDIPSQGSPFMLYSVKCLQPTRIPSGVHVDDTARLQTLIEDVNGRFYNLVKAFGEKTGIPVIINTSMNVQGEPICETPEDALKCFEGTEIDVLVLENYLIVKE